MHMLEQFVKHAEEGKPLQYVVPNDSVKEQIFDLIQKDTAAQQAFVQLNRAGLWQGFDVIESPWLNWSPGGIWY
jgi:hypothetical protein